MTLEPIDILGVQVHPLTTPELNQWITDIIDRNGRAQVLNVNVHGLNLAHKHDWLRDSLNEAEIVFCDGAGIILGARILGEYIPERITYIEWIWPLAELAEKKGYSFYFLGAKPGIAQAAAEYLLERHPKLKFVGIQDGYFNKTAGHPENEATIQHINQAHPNFLVLGMGMPIQEQWLHDNWDRLDVNIGLTGGGIFDLLSGDLKRPPSWMNNHSLEWLGRLFIAPKKLWRRYLIGNPVFLARVMRERLRRL